MIMPGRAVAALQRVRARGRPAASGAARPSLSPSIVVTDAPSACTASTVHDFTASPSRCTVQAPHDDVSQPMCVPVSPSSSRRKCTSNVRGSTSRSIREPLTVSAMVCPTCAPPGGWRAGWAYVGRVDHTPGDRATAILGTVDRVHVSAPASSANLGPGYDCLGVALPLRNDVVVERMPAPLEVILEGEGEGDPARRRDEPRRPGVPPCERPDRRRAALHAHESRAAALGHRKLERGDRGGARGRARADRVSPVDAETAAAARGRDGGTSRQRRPPRSSAASRSRSAASRRWRVASQPPAGLGVRARGARPTRCARRSRGRRCDPRSRARTRSTSLQRSALLVDLLATGALELLPRALSDRMHEPDRAALTPLLGQLRDARRCAAVLRGDALGCRPERARVGARGGNGGCRRRRCAPACPTRR